MEKGNYIGRMINNWRKRTVAIYDHPTDASLVITVGRPFDGGKIIECIETRKDWQSALDKIKDATDNGRVYKYD